MKLHKILIFRLARTLNEHGLKMPILANTLFGGQHTFWPIFSKKCFRESRAKSFRETRVRHIFAQISAIITRQAIELESCYTP